MSVAAFVAAAPLQCNDKDQYCCQTCCRDTAVDAKPPHIA
jgi:hypothetical protein